MVVKMSLPGVGKKVAEFSVAVSRGSVRKARFLTGAARQEFLKSWRAKVNVGGRSIPMKWVFAVIFIVLTVGAVIGFVEIFHLSMTVLAEWVLDKMVGVSEED